MLPAEGMQGSLKKQGIRVTRQRRILLDLIDKSGSHLDAEQLYELARKEDPGINRVTVYRTLKMLKAGQLVDELDLMHVEGDQHYYETRAKQEHAHVVCLRCGKVEEFYGEPLQWLRKQVVSSLGFLILVARTEVGGFCSQCQVLRARETSEAATNSPAGPSAKEKRTRGR
jgi:Fur family transcriptional regulator, ferric uptake regulator